MDPAGEKTVHSEFPREPVDEFDDEDFLAKEAEAVLPKSRRRVPGSWWAQRRGEALR